MVKNAENGLFLYFFTQNIQDTTYIILKTTQMVRLTRYGTKNYELFQFYLLLGAEKVYQNGRNFNKMGKYSKVHLPSKEYCILCLK